MIELLLQAERLLSMGLVDQAERLYRQAADADPRNSIAVVGLARVALERADDVEAWRLSRRALTIDPENAAARRLVARLEEVFAHRGQALPEVTPGGTSTDRSTGVEPSPDRPAAGPASRPEVLPGPSTTTTASTRGVVDRLLGRKRA